MGRIGVAATLVAVVLFTSMLLANSAVYSAEDGVLRSNVLSSAQLKEESLASFSSGIDSYHALASLQADLQAAPMDCLAAQPYLDSLAGDLSYSGNDGGVAFASNSVWAYSRSPVASAGDVLLPGFSGYSFSGLNIEVQTQVREEFVGGLPTYSVDSSEVVHLPVPVKNMVSECLAILSEASSALTALTSCTEGAVETLLAEAGSQYPGSSVVSSVSSSGEQCYVRYSVTITQDGIEGVSGTFAWSVFGSGSASLSISPLSGPPAA